jgi:hypothetical protein
LLLLFCECVDGGLISGRKPAANRLLEHVRSGLRSFIEGDRRTLDAAFGITRSGVGRPPLNDEEAIEIAATFLRLRISGLAYHQAKKKTGYDRNKVDAAWKAHKMAALTLFLKERATCGNPPTNEERARLSKIYRTKDGLLVPRGWKIQKGRLVRGGWHYGCFFLLKIGLGNSANLAGVIWR